MGSSHTRSLFGTDGVRGVANRDLTPELAMRLGRALAQQLPEGGEVLLGRDTRRSGPMLEAALAAGIASAGGDVALGGVLPTPAVADLVARGPAVAGAVISASHNPFPDNGIKLFGPDGFKLPDQEEADIERAMEDAGVRPEGAALGAVAPREGAALDYLDALLERFDLDLSGKRLCVDCANGATVTTAPEAFRRLGAEVTLIGETPDGVNINVGCGSTDLGALSSAVRSFDADLGLAFDGDGDRLLAVDGDGEVVDGDKILATVALWARGRGALPGDAVVTTTMTNLGFRRAMAAEGIEVRWTDVGDRYVLQEMRDGGFLLGGEQSGHMINLSYGPTGDGLSAALQLLAALGDSGQSLAQAASRVERLPQKLVSVRVARKDGLADAEAVWELTRRCESELADDGRVVVRASGTEPLVRVMVEAPTADQCERWANEIADAALRELGDASAEE